MSEGTIHNHRAVHAENEELVRSAEGLGPVRIVELPDNVAKNSVGDVAEKVKDIRDEDDPGIELEPAAPREEVHLCVYAVLVRVSTVQVQIGPDVLCALLGLSVVPDVTEEAHQVHVERVDDRAGPMIIHLLVEDHDTFEHLVTRLRLKEVHRVGRFDALPAAVAPAQQGPGVREQCCHVLDLLVVLGNRVVVHLK